MAGKRESLRQGEVVEVEPGVKGRLNFNDRTLELSTGEKLDLSERDLRELFPATEEEHKYARQKEEVEREIKQTPFGEFFHQLGQKGVVGGVKNTFDKIRNTGDEYLRLKKAEQEVEGRISEESPWTSRAATGASILGDIALTRGMSAVKAAPLLTTLSAGPRIVEEPLEVAKEAALAAGGGWLLDKGGSYLTKMAARRQASRQLPAAQAAVRESNIAGEAATAQKNLQQREAFNALSQRTKNENSALLHQHNLLMNERQNAMITAQNAYEKTKIAREGEVLRLKNAAETAKLNRSAETARLENEYKLAKTAADTELKRLNDEYKLATQHFKQVSEELPRLQREAQKEFSQNVIKNVGQIENAFPRNSRIQGSQIGVQDFIDESINTTGLAGSREGAQASRILKSLFPENDLLTAKDLAKRYQAIEEAIQRSTPGVQDILDQFKRHLGTRLPAVLEDTVAYSKIVPILEKKIEKEVAAVIKNIPFGKGEETTKRLLETKAKANLNATLRELGPKDFMRKLQSGELNEMLKKNILSAEDFLTDVSYADFAKLRKQGLHQYAEKAIQDKHNFFVNEIGNRINNTIARSELDIVNAAKEARKKLGRDIKKTYGVAEPVAAPVAPVPPEPPIYPSSPSDLPPVPPFELPPPIAPPETLPMPQKPTLYGEPSAPIPQRFSAQPEPTLAAPSGGLERIADRLEKPLLKGKPMNQLLKLGALKYALGPAALPVEIAGAGAYGAAKLLTSPGTAGNVARLSFRQGGIQAIEAMAQKYPSYRNGVLENPQERRSLTREIEDDQEIPLEQKALLQSKINRGKPIGGSL